MKANLNTLTLTETAWALHTGSLSLDQLPKDQFEFYSVSWQHGHTAGTETSAARISQLEGKLEQATHAAIYAMHRRGWGARDAAELVKAYGLSWETYIRALGRLSWKAAA